MPEALARVGISATALLTPLTGIGRYTWHLAREMQRLLPEPPWLFDARRWTREIPVPPQHPRENMVVTLVKRAVPFGFEAARFLQQRRFTSGARAHGIALYHEPNFLAFRFAGPMVVTVHDLSWVRFPETHPAERVRAMNAQMPKVLRAAAHVIADSEFTRGEVIAHYGIEPARVTTVLLGVTPGFAPFDERACAATLATHGLRYGEYILAVGTLEPRKNLATAVAAFAGLPQEQRRRHPLVVAGMHGWGRHRLPRALQGLVAAGEARLLGYVAEEDLPRLYAGARLFVYPSVYEGFGLPPLEAMACGAPVVVSRSASLPQVVGGAGLLVDPMDQGAWREQMRVLLEDDALRARLSAAGVRQAQGFTWERCARDTLAVYRKAIGAASMA